MDLFSCKQEERRFRSSPLADRIRPEDFEDYVGQDQIVGSGTVLRKAIEKDEVPSMILWGPPGTGKTTLAHLIAQKTKAHFVPFSAVHNGVKEVREIIKEAEEQQKYYQKRTILFVDEIHRFDKRQQDAFLSSVENGIIILIGATTENPSFEINAALLSRCRVFVLTALTSKQIEMILKRALKNEKKGLGNLSVSITDELITFLAQASNGDVRTALNALELAVQSSQADDKGLAIVDEETAKQALQRTHLLYDRAGEEHHNIISALHKSMRGSDANAALYWLGRMLEAGEDPLYVARRLVRFASEDIGLADPQALVQAVSSYQASHFLGMPECNVCLAQTVAYLSRAPKSNALYTAYMDVQKDIHEHPTEPVPLHLRNAPTNLMKNLGYGKDYKYTPNFEDPKDAAQEYLPPLLKNKKYLP